MGWHLCERLDDLHLAATLGTGRLTLVVVGGRRGVFWFGGHRSGVWGRGRDLLRRKQLVDAGEFGFPMAVGKEAVMADALEAVGQNVEQKAADELGRCKRHELDERTVAVVLPTEGNVIIGDLDEAMIGDGDAVCIAAQIAQNLFGPGQGLLAVDDPIDPPDRRKVSRKSPRVCQMHKIGEELQAPIFVGGSKFAQKHAPEQA